MAVPYSFYSDDLDSLRLTLLQQGFAVRAALSAPHCLRALSIPIDKNKFCSIYSIPENAEELKEWVEKVQYTMEVPLSYRHEGLPATTLRVLIALLKEHRQYLSLAQKKQLVSVGLNVVDIDTVLINTGTFNPC